MIEYPYGFAQYPDSFLGCKVSPTKICLQFNSPEIKLRPLGEDKQMLPRIDGKAYVKMTEDAQRFKVAAVGCQMPVLEELQTKLLVAYKDYYKQNRQTYKEAYGKEFGDFLRVTKSKIDNLVNYIEREENDYLTETEPGV